MEGSSFIVFSKWVKYLLAGFVVAIMFFSYLLYRSMSQVEKVEITGKAEDYKIFKI